MKQQKEQECFNLLEEIRKLNEEKRLLNEQVNAMLTTITVLEADNTTLQNENKKIASETEKYLKLCNNDSVPNYELKKRTNQDVKEVRKWKVERKQEDKENVETQSAYCSIRNDIVHRNATKQLGGKSPKKRLMFADESGRSICPMLHNMADSDTTVSGNIFSGAGLDVILKAVISNKEQKNFTKNDTIVLTGGSNDVTNQFKYRNVDRLLRRIDRAIEALSHTNVIIFTLPYRYNQPSQSTCNRMIMRFNEDIKNITQFYDVALIDLYDLQIQDRAPHKQLSNRTGEKTICQKDNAALQGSYR
ncbi:hypothetical protein LSTR_LSTR005252 [Laodelphax striatellus]|uniref:SGNH hydrolase-type esterase domain-containing protein n=1 Tax=Laodelphax striatellus TaxID=195883 RepID=A0A482X8J0_LAOST|nr:hypothetical protein LSTR_LSTR005252 [Laodelphax striatellus]